MTYTCAECGHALEDHGPGTGQATLACRCCQPTQQLWPASLNRMNEAGDEAMPVRQPPPQKKG